jgi:hypothetical protein
MCVYIYIVIIICFDYWVMVIISIYPFMIMIMIIAQSFHHYHFRSEYLIPRVFWSVFPYFSLNFVHSSHLNSHRHSPHRTQGQARREAAKASAGEGSMKPCWKPRRRRTWARQKNHETWGLFEREKWGGVFRETFEVKTMQTGDFQQQRGNFGQEKIRFEQGRLQIFLPISILIFSQVPGRLGFSSKSRRPSQ